MKSANFATHISCLVNRSVLGDQGRKYQRLIEKYVDTNGIEWTVNRLKACWTASLHLKNGDREKAETVYRSKSIAYTSKGYPKDPLLALPMKRFVLSTKPSRVKKYAAVLRCYTLLSLNKVSQGQALNVAESIGSKPKMLKPVRQAAIQRGLILIMDAIHHYGIPQKGWKFRKQDFSLDQLAPFTSTYQGRPYSKPIRTAKAVDKGWFKAVHSMMTTSYLPPVLHNVVPGWEIRDRQKKLFERKLTGVDLRRASAPGKIHIIQEGGAKARAVAIPNAWVQMGFVPLHKRLSALTAQYLQSESCVHDQTLGAKQVLKNLAAGKEIFSVDLSSATDRFPVDLQLGFLKAIGLEGYATALADVCNQEWEFPQGKNFGIPTVKYSVGQPMGLYGSFPLFNATHILLAKGLEIELNRKNPNLSLEYFEDGSSFKVVGDDIVFADKRLSEVYISILTALDVPVSPTKTFEGRVAEFAGFIMLPAKAPNGVMGFRPYKYPQESFITNPINLLDSLGIAVKRMSPRWHHIFDVYAYTANQRRMDLAPIFQDGTPMVGLSGELSIQTVARYRDMICSYGRGSYLDREGWFCKEPIVYDGPRERSPLLVPREREDRKVETTRVDHPPVSPMDAGAQQVSGKHHYKTARRVWKDPLMAAWRLNRQEVNTSDREHACKSTDKPIKTSPRKKPSRPKP